MRSIRYDWDHSELFRLICLSILEFPTFTDHMISLSNMHHLGWDLDSNWSQIFDTYSCLCKTNRQE